MFGNHTLDIGVICGCLLVFAIIAVIGAFAIRANLVGVLILLLVVLPSALLLTGMYSHWYLEQKQEFIIKKNKQQLEIIKEAIADIIITGEYDQLGDLLK